MVTQRRTVIHRSPWSHKGKQSYTARHGHTKADSQSDTAHHGHTKAYSQSYTARHGHTKANSHAPLTMVTQRRTVSQTPLTMVTQRRTVIHRSPWSHKGGQSDSQGRRETTTSAGTQRETGTPGGTRNRQLVQHVFSGQGRTPARATRVSADKEGHRLVTPVNRGELSGQNCSNPSNAQTGQTRDTTLQYSTLRYTTLHYITLHLL